MERQEIINFLEAIDAELVNAKDRQDLQIICDAGQLDVDRLRQGLESAFAWAEKEDPDREIAARNLLRVIDYLEGKSRTL